MGNFYTNVTIKGPSAAQVMQVVKGLPCGTVYVLDLPGCVVIAEQGHGEEFLEQLTAKLDCSALGLGNADDSTLFYDAFHAGNLVDKYCSTPELLEEYEISRNGNAQALCAAFGVSEASARVDEILHRQKYTFEFERHFELVKALGMPAAALTTHFDDLHGVPPDDWPEEATLRNCKRIEGKPVF